MINKLTYRGYLLLEKTKYWLDNWSHNGIDYDANLSIDITPDGVDVEILNLRQWDEGKDDWIDVSLTPELEQLTKDVFTAREKYASEWGVK